jgi:hypothetical protein
MTTTNTGSAKMVKCIKCQGTGKVIWAHIDNGRCFACQGTGKVEIKPVKGPVAGPKASYDAALELRRLYGAGRSHIAAGEKAWIVPEQGHDESWDGLTTAKQIAYHLIHASTEIRAEATLAFQALLGSGWAYVEREIKAYENS